MTKQRVREITFSDELTDLLTPRDRLTAEQALNVPAVTACVEFISGTVAMLPINLYHKTENGIEQVKDMRWRLLNRNSFDTLDVYAQRKQMIRDYLIKGAGYLYIDRYRNDVRALRYVDAEDVSVTVSPDPIFREVGVYVGGRRYEAFDFIHIARNAKDGFHGIGVIDSGSEIIKAAYNSILMENKTAKVGGNRRGILLADKPVGDKALTRIKAAWKKVWNSFGNDESDNTIVLENGVTFKETSATFNDMQLAELKQVNSKEICKLFCSPPTVIDGTANAENYTGGIRTAILPVVEVLTAALNENYLLEAEKEDYYWEIDITELLKGDILKRYQAYEVARRNNFMMIDEIREKENLPPIDADFINLGLADVLYFPGSKKIYTPNTNAMADLTLNDMGSMPIGPQTEPKQTQQANRAFESGEHPRAEDGRFTFKAVMMGDCRDENGTFQIEKAKEEYIKFLTTDSNSYKIMLEGAMDEVSFEQDDSLDVAFAYKKDKNGNGVVKYNPTAKKFDSYTVRVAFTHEIAHHLDIKAFRSYYDTDFADAVYKSREKALSKKDFWKYYCKHHDNDGFLSDIISAASRGEIKVKYGHNKSYWRKRTKRIPAEVFSNMFSLNAMNDIKKLNLIQEEFPDLYDTFEQLPWSF